MERIEGTLERVDPFHLPIFQYLNAINDEQCKALREMCVQQTYESSLQDYHGEDKISKATEISIDKQLLHRIPDMKQHFELLLQDISFQIMRQNSEGFEIKSSWSTKTRTGQASALHMHKNYYMAGVLYLQEGNNLVIECPHWMNGHFLFPVYQQSPYTCNSTMISSPKNSLLLMPAWMKHEIPVWEGEEDRYSIAMNFHPVGEYGLETSWISVK